MVTYHSPEEGHQRMRIGQIVEYLWPDCPAASRDNRRRLVHAWIATGRLTAVKTEVRGMYDVLRESLIMLKESLPRQVRCSA
jgi:hypothetical protein